MDASRSPASVLPLYPQPQPFESLQARDLCTVAASYAHRAQTQSLVRNWSKPASAPDHQPAAAPAYVDGGGASEARVGLSALDWALLATATPSPGYVAPSSVLRIARLQQLRYLPTPAPTWTFGAAPSLHTPPPQHLQALVSAHRLANLAAASAAAAAARAIATSASVAAPLPDLPPWRSAGL